MPALPLGPEHDRNPGGTLGTREHYHGTHDGMAMMVLLRRSRILQTSIVVGNPAKLGAGLIAENSKAHDPLEQILIDLDLFAVADDAVPDHVPTTTARWS